MSDSPVGPVPATPKVSVAMWTYNHERFIAQAIESVLMQQSGFSIELVIGEDCSTDGTRHIVEHYARLWPNIIRPLLHARNLGPYENARAVLGACRGEFIALLDGDDYWTDPRKLHKQVLAIDSNPNCNISCHAVAVVNEKGLPKLEMFEAQKSLKAPSGVMILHPLDLLQPCVVVTNAVLMRRESIDLRELAEFSDSPAGDLPLFMLACRGKQVHFSAEVMSAYREHAGGVTRTFNRPETLTKLGKMYELLAEKFQGRDDQRFRHCIYENYLGAARGFADSGKLSLSLSALNKAFYHSDTLTMQLLHTYCKNVVRACWKSIFKPTKTSCGSAAARAHETNP